MCEMNTQPDSPFEPKPSARAPLPARNSPEWEPMLKAQRDKAATESRAAFEKMKLEQPDRIERVKASLAKGSRSPK